MLKLYDALGRFANWLLKPLFPVLSRHSTRVRALVVSDQQKILLTRSWLGFQRWGLPGGGIKRGEPPTVAAAREVFEETGVLLGPSSFVPLGEFANTDSHAPFTVTCMIARAPQVPTHVAWWRRYEILESQWFDLGDLPEHRSPNVDAALSLYTAKQ